MYLPHLIPEKVSGEFYDCSFSRGGHGAAGAFASRRWSSPFERYKWPNSDQVFPQITATRSRGGAPVASCTPGVGGFTLALNNRKSRCGSASFSKMKSVACEIRIEATTFKQNCFCSSITNAKQRANVNRTSCWPQRQSGDRDESRAARCALRIQCQLRARHTIHRYDKSPVSVFRECVWGTCFVAIRGTVPLSSIPSNLSLIWAPSMSYYKQQNS